MKPLLEHQLNMLREARPGSDAERLGKALLTANQRIEWLQALWANFQKRAKTQREMSSSEYHVASKWLDRGLPLAVVLRALQDFQGTPRRLEALEGAVNEAAAYNERALS